MNGQDEQGSVNGSPFEGAGEGTAPAAATLPKLRPHLTVIRQITYQGDAEAIRAQLALSLPDGLLLAGQGTFTIRVETAEPREDAPQWLGEVKGEIELRVKNLQAQAAREKAPLILNPHTLRPVK